MLYFNRYKNTSVELVENTTFKVNSAMCDTFHEINLTVIVNIEDLKVKEAKIEFLRFPGKACKETAKLADNLIGVSMGKGISKTAIEKVGGSLGCTHLVDLVLEAAKALVQGKFHKQFIEVDNPEKAHQDIGKQLEGTCFNHSNH